MTKKPLHAPDCWGSAVYLNLDKVRCQRCLYNDSCLDGTFEAIRLSEYKKEWMRKKRAEEKAAKKREARIRRLRESGGWRAVILKGDAARTRRELTKTQKEKIKTLSFRAKSVAKTMIQSEHKIVGIREHLRAGKNPFEPRGPQFLTIFCRLLIEGGFQRRNLVYHLKTECEWSEGTAQTYATHLLQSFLIFDLIYKSKKDGAYRIKRTRCTW